MKIYKYKIKKPLVIIFIALQILLLPVYFHIFYYLYLVDIIKETEYGRGHGCYKDAIFRDLVEQTYIYFEKSGSIKPSRYYYGPINKNIYFMNYFNYYQEDIPSWKRSEVPVDPFTNGVLFGKWYYGPGTRGKKTLYTGDPVYYFTDGKTYFGLVWADKDGKRHFKPSPNDTTDDLMKIKKGNVNIYYAEEINGERKMYRGVFPDGEKFYLQKDEYGTFFIP